ncbi:MAG: DUF4358 domain-containing protein [Anaerovoracaceae bacterium]
MAKQYDYESRLVMTHKIQKIFFIIILLVFMFLAYANGNAKDVPISDIESALKASTELSTSMEKCKNKDLMHFFSLNYQDFDSYIYYKNPTALSVEELLIVKVKDKSDLLKVEDAAEERTKSQLAVFEGYGPEQVNQLSNCITTTRGDYLFFCVSKNPDAYMEVFKNVIQ